MAKKKKRVTKKSKTTRKKAKRKALKKATRKKATKKKASKKKSKKKKSTRKKATKKKSTRKKATKKKSKKKKSTRKKATKKKTTKKKATRKKATKKSTRKAAPKKRAKTKATKTKTKKSAKTKTTAKRATVAPTNLVTYTPQVTVGEVVPPFCLPATSGKTVTMGALRSRRVVLFFYPKDATPGCTIEGHDFTNLNEKFENRNTLVFGISRDSLKSHEKFKENQKYSIELISDTEEELCRIFGVIKLKNMYGKQVRGIDRSTFVLDENGVLLKEWRGVKVPNHAQEVYEYVQSLSDSSTTLSQNETADDEVTVVE